MDIESRLEELARARAAGLLDETEWVRRRAELLRESTMVDDSRTSAETAAKGTESVESEPDLPIKASGLETLDSGTVIGPPERRVRLLRDLDGKGQVWLAVALTEDTERASGAGDEFRVVKLFLPVGRASSPRESGREERSQRADLIGWRTYLTKMRARVEPAAQLDHPQIARVYGWRHGADGWPFVEMEYVDLQRGQSLEQLLKEQGQNGLPWGIVLKWLKPVATALDYARREQRLAHQHLNAGTVILTRLDEIKLLGFGLTTEVVEPRSVLFDTSESVEETGTDSANDAASVEAAFRRDVFALALLVYRMLMGQSAYEAKGELTHLIPRPPGLTDEAWRFLRRGLAYPSELCPTDAGKFMGELEAAQQPADRAKRGGSSPLWNWLLVAGLLLLVVLGIYRLTRQGDEKVSLDQPKQTEASADGRSKPVGAPEQSPTTGLTVLLQEAEREADSRAFESAKRMDTLVAYQLYLQRCPRCGFEQEARVAMQNLQTEQKIDKLKTDFETFARAFERENGEEQGAGALGRLNALAALIPGDPFVVTARRRLALDWLALARASVEKGDLIGAQQRLKKAESIQANLPEIANLAAMLKQAELTERARQADVEAFAAARRANNRKAYWTYLERCPAVCNFRAEAEAALARLNPANRVMRDRLDDGSQGPELVVIPAGGFEMGSPASEKGRYDDERQHPARIAKSFAIGKYEVMFFEYDRFATATGRSLPGDEGWGRNRHPVINVAWRDAKEFTGWLTRQTGHRYRLPTETEWEYAARAGTTTSRYWGDDPDEGCAYANVADQDGKKVFVGWTAARCHDGHVYTALAGSYRNNDYGLHDMLGNVLEWTCSLYTPDYQAPSQDCEEPADERTFVVRGGSWNDEPRNVRSGDRHRYQSDFHDYFLGFRVVRELP